MSVRRIRCTPRNHACSALRAEIKTARMLRNPPPIVMLIAALLMWALHRWMPLGHWTAPAWNRLGAVAGVLGVAVAVPPN
jgi:uncharacterized protein (DUF983 family)